VASKRIYISVPHRDYYLILRTATLSQECLGQWCRRAVLTELYRLLGEDTELQDYDAALARAERERMVHGR